jgi:signal transduction histidine kinase
MKNVLALPFARLRFSREFLLVGTTVVLAAMAIFGAWLGRQIESSVVNRAAQIAAIYVESVVTAELREWSGSGALPVETHRALDRIFVDGTLRSKVLGFKVWSGDGQIIYSGDHGQLGRRYTIDEKLAAAFAGEVQSRINIPEAWHEPDTRPAPGTRQLEIYVPVRGGPKGEVTAVAEFDHSMEALDNDIRASQQRGWMMTALCALAIYSLMFSRVRRASDTIADQQRALGAQVEQLRSASDENLRMRQRLSEAGARTTTLGEQYLNRIAADLHDGPAQELAYALLRFDDLEVLCNGCVASGGHRPSEMTGIHQALRTSLSELRAIAAGLGVPGIDDLSLAETAQRALRDAEQKSACPVKAEIDATLGPAPMALKITVYRVIRESLANCWRYAGPATPEVSVRHRDSDVDIEIRDQGPGFDPARALASGRLGLLLMRERVRLAGGIFEIDSAPGRGTTIRAHIPLSQD